MALGPKQIAAVIMDVGGFCPVRFWGVTDNDIARQAAESWFDVAIAVCLAESGGNPSIKNGSSSAIGLWQIMQSVHEKKINDAITAWSAELQKRVDITHPAVNTQVAAWLFQERGWQPWEAYNTGAYRRYIGKGYGKQAYAYLQSDKVIRQRKQALRAEYISGIATAELGGLAAGAVTGVGAVNSLASLTNGDLMQSALTFLKDAGIAVGVGLLAVVLVILGVWFVVSQTNAGKVVKKALPV